MAEYYNTKASVEEYIQMAKDVHGGELIAKLKPLIPADSRVLELGSGPGTDWKLLSADYKVVGSDNSPEFLHHLQTTFRGGRFLDLDAITIDTTERFDVIYSNKVMHHLHDEELRQSIRRQQAVLEPGGIICHSFWKGEGSEVFKGLYVNYHTSESLGDFFGPNFDFLLVQTYAEFEAEDSILMIAKRK